MNTIMLLKSLVRKPLINLKQEASPISIPTSQLAGIVALPTELWSIIIDYTILQLINEDTPPSDELTPALNLRLVCREFLLCTQTLTQSVQLRRIPGIFNKEVLHALHTNITLAHFPRISSTYLLLWWSHTQRKSGLHTTLFTSAILNTAHTTKLPIVSQKLAARLLNCLTVAESLSRLHHAPFHEYIGSLEEVSLWDFYAVDKLYRLCHAAALSTCCQEYMCRPEQFYARYGEKERLKADVCLEVALLAACGYEVKRIKNVMIRLAKAGELIGHEAVSKR